MLTADPGPRRPPLAQPPRPVPFRVATLNVFVGSPLPFLFGATSSLPNSKRLQAQVDGLDAMHLDVLCLQELVCKETLSAVQRVFTSDQVHCLHFARETGLSRGVCLAWSWIVLFSIGLVAATCSAVSAEVPNTNLAPTTATFTPWICLVTLLFFGVVLCMQYIVRTSAIYVWLTGFPTGLVVFVRKQARVEIHAVTETLFTEQHGDPLNFFNPRGFIRIDLLVDGVDVQLVNTHLNHGATGCRHRQAQIEQITCSLQIAALGNSHCPLIVGDLNVPRCAPEVEWLCFQNEVFNALEGKPTETRIPVCTWLEEENPLTRNVFLRKKGNRQLDFILPPTAETTLSLIDCRTIFTYAPYVSDHLGVLAEFEIIQKSIL
jgi:endonuclease/exonuclease/phosphatase family metal-dependent hydrolase